MSPSGNEAFSVTQPAPPADELSESHGHDGGQPLVYGSAATYADQAAGANTPEVTIIAEEPARFSLPDSSQPDLVPHRGSAAVGQSNEPLLYGSAQTIAGDANRPQYGSGQVVAEDPNVSNLDPGLALPYGNNELGPAAVKGTIVLAPQTGGASGAVDPKLDPSLYAAPSRVTMGAGNNDAITDDLPTSGTASASQGNASGTSLLPSQKVDPNAGGAPPPTQKLSETGQGVSDTSPHAPQTQSQPASEVANVEGGEQGVASQDIKPPVQYGQSAP